MDTSDAAASVRSMLMAFVPISDVLTALEMSMGELDELCRSKFACSASAAVERFAAQGRASIHEAQVAAALEGDRSMLLLLGKQYLGQSGEQAPETAAEETPLDRVRSKYAAAKDRKSKAAR